jgi:hypothetical protein
MTSFDGGKAEDIPMNVDKVVQHLNEFLSIDWNASQRLFSFRVPITDDDFVEDSPFTFADIEGKIYLGVLGILNGIVGGKIIMMLNVNGETTEFITEENYLKEIAADGNA